MGGQQTSIENDPAEPAGPVGEFRSPSDAPDPLPVYSPFGKFQLIAQLGKGGMGEVFLALLNGIQGVKKLVVIKRLIDSITEDRAMRELFLEEGRLAARLNHSNVVQTIEVGEEAGALYLSMEYLEGQPLNQVMRKLGEDRIEAPLAARIVSDVLCGLHYAHELRDYDGRPLNIVHRDMSPHNIFITYEGEVKIVDFGIAKAASHISKTEVGVFKGKVAYMAPEQVTTDSTDRRADIFVVGIVLWELLTGTRLFAGAVQKTFYSLIQKPAPRVSSIVLDIDPELDDIVAKALDRDPNARFATAKEMRDAIDGYIASTGRLVRAEDLGDLLGRLFQKRRDRVRRQVRTYMSAVEAARSTQELPLLAPRRDGEGSDSALSAALHTPVISGTHSLPTSVDAPLKPAWWSRRSVQLSLGALALLVFGGLLAARSRSVNAEHAQASAGAGEPQPAALQNPTNAAKASAPPQVELADLPALSGDPTPSTATSVVAPQPVRVAAAKAAKPTSAAPAESASTARSASTVSTSVAQSSPPAESSLAPAAPGKRKFRMTF
jgi:serine/threonine protein kinase